MFHATLVNLVLTFLLLIVSILIKKYNLPLKKAILYFMTVFIVTRLSIFSVYFAPILEKQKLLNIGLYFTIFSLIFLVTILIVNMAVSVASAMNLYRTGSVTDHLTGLYNRRMFTSDLNASFHGQNKIPSFCLAILDIDDFKAINDQYGHHVGDLVLKHFSSLLQESFPDKNGQLYRIGGEEFAFLTHLSKEETTTSLEKFRQNLSTNPFHYHENTIIISTSIGLTQFDHEVDSNNYEGSTAVYSRADRALYEAKRTGKNKLIIF